jgi:hypothetical protein
VGTPEYSTSHIQATGRKIVTDLELLQDFSFLHHRVKLALYCCNTRISYLLRAVPTPIIQPLMLPLDAAFESFFADSLSFEDNYTRGQHALAYQQALQQCRFGIKQGGLGLTSATLVAPAALYVALRQFREWYGFLAQRWAHRSIHNAPWLAALTAPYVESEHFFPYFRSTFDSTLSILHSKWQIPGSEHDTRTQPQIVQLIKASEYSRFTASLSTDTRKRIMACAQQSFPTRSAGSDIRPALHEQHDSDHLRHGPMGLFSLACPCELSNAAFLTSSSATRCLSCRRWCASWQPRARRFCHPRAGRGSTRWWCRSRCRRTGGRCVCWARSGGPNQAAGT